MTEKEYTHYTKDWNGVKCGYTYWMNATDIKTDERIDCPVCLDLLKQERREQSETPQMDEWRKQMVKELGFGQYQKEGK